MSSELIDLLEREANAERDRLLAEARQQAEEMVKTAAAEAERVRAAAKQRLEGELRTARIKAQSTAQLQAASLVLRTKDDVLSTVFSRAEEKLRRTIEDRDRYARMLRVLIKEGAAGLSGGLTVEVAERDLPLAQAAARDLGIDAEVRGSPGINVGTRVTSGDGRFVVDNTLASRLARAKPALMAEVARVLWEG
ncbi:MAG: hypothetical protein HY660_14905 [Armatimonadetes bacterium]|nr:hypothetical protein [Armatimonadota bacterium]